MDALLATADLMLVSKLTAAAQRTQTQAVAALDLPSFQMHVDQGSPKVVFLDLSAAWLDVASAVEQLRKSANPPQAIIAFGPHVQEGLLQTASDAGCDLVLARGQFHAQLDTLLKKYAS